MLFLLHCVYSLIEQPDSFNSFNNYLKPCNIIIVLTAIKSLVLESPINWEMKVEVRVDGRGDLND